MCVPMRGRPKETPENAELREVVDAWSRLPADVRRSIVKVVRATPRKPL